MGGAAQGGMRLWARPSTMAGGVGAAYLAEALLNAPQILGSLDLLLNPTGAQQDDALPCSAHPSSCLTHKGPCMHMCTPYVPPTIALRTHCGQQLQHGLGPCLLKKNMFVYSLAQGKQAGGEGRVSVQGGVTGAVAGAQGW